ncbi:MAG TPA: hypothetical protein VH817_16435 [Thermoleophilaceae bacterium]|jgi:hypothetical protein
MSLVDWLIEPPILDRGATVPTKQDVLEKTRPIVAVIGLAPGAGTTTLARGIAATLARRDPSGAAIVTGRHEPTSPLLSLPSAARLAARMESAQPLGRLCLTSSVPEGSEAPLVLDGAPTPAAHLTILLAPADAEPALAELAARTHNAQLTVVNGSDERWHKRAFLSLPQSRLGARLAQAGWEPPGALGKAIARLADSAEEAA